MRLRAAVEPNPIVGEVLRRLPSLGVPDAWLTSGCLFQTVWNVRTGQAPTTWIRDYDLFYFDDHDVSWEAEDEVIRRAAQLFGDLGVDVEVRNQARVHLWFADHFGVSCPPHASSKAAIDRFAATTCAVGIAADGEEYAPYGLDDVFDLVLRPNPVLAPRWVYEEKALRWKAQWPALEVLPWPSEGQG